MPKLYKISYGGATEFVQFKNQEEADGYAYDSWRDAVESSSDYSSEVATIEFLLDYGEDPRDYGCWDEKDILEEELALGYITEEDYEEKLGVGMKIKLKKAEAYHLMFALSQIGGMGPIRKTTERLVNELTETLKVESCAIGNSGQLIKDSFCVNEEIFSDKEFLEFWCEYQNANPLGDGRDEDCLQETIRAYYKHLSKELHVWLSQPQAK